MSDVVVKWNPPDFPRRLERNLRNAPAWMLTRRRKAARQLGRLGVDAMRDMVDVNRYTGKLGSSISATYQDDGATAVISPKVMRGRWDGGLILEMGTRPIPNAPWAPIKKWANFKGLPGFPVWYKIRMHGVAAHPFLMRTWQAVLPETNVVLSGLLDDAIKNVFEGL